MPFMPHAAARAAESLLKAAEASHTSGAVLIFLRVVDAGSRIEFVMGVLSLLAMLMLISDAARFLHALATAARRTNADSARNVTAITPAPAPVEPER